jgi:taurine dioxygenase
MYGIVVDNDRLDRIQPKILDMTRYLASPAETDGVTVTPYSPTVGARVGGLRIDGEGAVAPGVRKLLYDALLRYGFLSFEPGTVGVEHFEQLVSLFGKAKLMNTPYTPETGKSGQLNTIDASTKKTRMNYIWHMDQVFQPTSPPYTALLGEVMPALGGDTLFANATAAYDLLDPLLVAYLETLSAVHDADTMGYLTLAYHDLEARAEQRRKYPPIEVPLIRTHPETGRKQIFVNELYTHRILGVSRRTSQALLDILFDALSAPEVQARHRWESGTALIWDNRTVQHRGVPDFGPQRRVMHRALVLPKEA